MGAGEGEGKERERERRGADEPRGARQRDRLSPAPLCVVLACVHWVTRCYHYPVHPSRSCPARVARCGKLHRLLPSTASSPSTLGLPRSPPSLHSTEPLAAPSSRTRSRTSTASPRSPTAALPRLARRLRPRPTRPRSSCGSPTALRRRAHSSWTLKRCVPSSCALPLAPADLPLRARSLRLVRPTLAPLASSTPRPMDCIPLICVCGCDKQLSVEGNEAHICPRYVLPSLDPLQLDRRAHLALLVRPGATTAPSTQPRSATASACEPASSPPSPGACALTLHARSQLLHPDPPTRL